MYTGRDANAQAARIRRQLERLAPVARVLFVSVVSLLAGHAAIEALHSAIIANALTRTKGTAVSLAERSGVNRHKVTAHVGIIEGGLVGARCEPGRFDTTSERMIHTCA